MKKLKIGDRVCILQPCMWAGYCGTVEDLGKILPSQERTGEPNGMDSLPPIEEDEKIDCVLVELDDNHQNIIVRLTQCEIIHA